VTIPIAQDIKEDVKFNVSGVRVFQYGPMPDELKRAVREIVTAAVEGLRGPHKVDSPVRSSLELTTLPQAELDALIAENNRLKETLGDDLVAAARKSSPAEAISLLRQAISRNPVNSQARYELGVALRKAADYPGAIAELREAVRLRDDWAEAWRELGVALNKDGKLGDADQAFRRAVELNPDDAETWSTLGGLRRRLARSSAGSFDWEMLRESRDAYHRASQLLGNDTYSLVNEARVNLLLSAEDPSTRAAALAQLRDLEDLARYEARSGDPWKVFDLTDTYLLTGRAEDGLTRLRSAIESIDPSQRKSYLTSYIDPLRDFLAVGVLDEDADKGVRQAIGICEKAIEAARQLTP
jgi:tetratricopeptide (TPR) repeat protein